MTGSVPFNESKPTHDEAIIAFKCGRYDIVFDRLEATAEFDRIRRTADSQSDDLIGLRRTIRRMKECRAK